MRYKNWIVFYFYNFLGIDLTKSNVLEIVEDLLHIGFWHNNTNTVQKLYKIFNKIFSETTI